MKTPARHLRDRGDSVDHAAPRLPKPCVAGSIPAEGTNGSAGHRHGCVGLIALRGSDSAQGSGREGGPHRGAGGVRSGAPTSRR